MRGKKTQSQQLTELQEMLTEAREQRNYWKKKADEKGVTVELSPQSYKELLKAEERLKETQEELRFTKGYVNEARENYYRVDREFAKYKSQRRIDLGATLACVMLSSLLIGRGLSLESYMLSTPGFGLLGWTIFYGLGKRG